MKTNRIQFKNCLFTIHVLIQFAMTKNAKAFFVFGMLLFNLLGIQAVTYYGKTGVSPHLTTSWGTTSGGGGTNPSSFTNAGDNFIIESGTNMTANAAWNIGAAGTTSSTLQINSSGTLDMGTNLLTLASCDFINSGIFSGSGGVTISGTLATNSIAGFTTTGIVSMTKTSGAATFTGNVTGGGLTINGTGGTLNLGSDLTHTFYGQWLRTNGTLNGGSSTLNIGGAVSGTGGIFTAETGTINFNGFDDQTIPLLSYYNLTISGSGTKTYSTASTLTPNLLIVVSGAELLLDGTIKKSVLKPVSAQIYGTVSIKNEAIFENGTGIVSFNSGSVLNFASEDADFPTAMWDVNSTLMVTANFTKTINPKFLIVNFAQSFGNFIWNCTEQTEHIQLRAELTTVKGDFSIINTGNSMKSLSLGSNKIGDFNVGGNFTQTGGYFYCSGFGGQGGGVDLARNINIGGNFLLTGGIFDLSNSFDSGNGVIVNVGKDFTHTGGTLTESGVTTGSTISFIASSSPHIYTSGALGIITNTVNFVVKDGATLQMGTAANPSVISGSNGSFTLQSGSWLRVTSPDGITKTASPATLLGNIQVTGDRFYSSGSVEYMGNTHQVTGDGLFAAVNLLINNYVGVTFSVQAAISDNIEIRSSLPITNLNNDFVHTATTLTLVPDIFITGSFGAMESPASSKMTTFFQQEKTGIILLKDPCFGKPSYTWTGDVDDNWNVPGNWCIKLVPDTTSDVVIPPNKQKPQPVIRNTAAVCHNISIYPGATVNISEMNTLNVYGNFIDHGGFFTASGTVTVNGFLRIENGSYECNTGTLILNKQSSIVNPVDEDYSRTTFTNNGNFDPGSGKVILNCNGEQSIGGNSSTNFYNLISTGTGTKILTTYTTVREALTIDTLSVVALSSNTLHTPSLIIKDMIFCKTSSHSAEFYRNNNSLSLTGKVRTKVKFDNSNQWHYISFPYNVTAVLKSDGTAAINGNGKAFGDFSIAQYNAQTRANNRSGWEYSYDNPMVKSKGYIIRRLYPNPTNLVLYFESNEDTILTPDMFNDSKTYNLKYVTGNPYFLPNFGWNFIAHPLSVTATPSLANGQFAYGYDASRDIYKIYYGINNPGYMYQAAGMRPFEAYFLKTNSAAELSFTSTITARQGIRAYLTPENNAEEVFALNLNVNDLKYETLIRIMSVATVAHDELYDAPYNMPISTETPRAYTLIGSDMYALNSVPDVSTVTVGIKVPQAGSYNFSWDVSSITVPLCFTDIVSGIKFDMKTINKYDFTTNTSGEINNRFIIDIGQQETIETIEPLQDKVIKYKVFGQDKYIRVEGLDKLTKITIYNIAYKIVYANQVSSVDINIPVPHPGIYLVELTQMENTYKKKVICK